MNSLFYRFFARFLVMPHLACATLFVQGMALLGWAEHVQAHPHAWIDVHSAVVFNDTGRIAAIEQQWRFDELYTAALIHGMTAGQAMHDAAARDEILLQYTHDVINNLHPYGYFMRVRANGRAIALGNVTTYQSALDGKRFVLRFTAPLAAPVDPFASQIEFAVYDPTYFIQMMHLGADPPRLVGVGATACQAHVQAPNPTPAMLARALALDRGAPADDTLGEMFAQKVRLQCRQERRAQ